ncbi:MAG: hypothetical protein KGY61_05135 [Desulfobacterales bacterium]|nr:hypothetical protein [Desulfobacterales bacterium]
MTRKIIIPLAGIFLLAILASGCSMFKDEKPTVAPLHTVQQINSFKPEIACNQAVEVINSNPYSQEFFEDVFAKIVRQCKSSESPKNADIIWDHFVKPLKRSGKVPKNLVVTTWNYYFSSHFASLPDTGAIENYCYKLPEIKKNLEKEYRMKMEGFAAADQGSPDSYFMNAMYIYNTMWAACHPNE